MAADSNDRYAHLRVRATARKQETVDRLRRGCIALKARDEPINVDTIKRETGLAHTVYSRRRNPDAYAVFVQYADFFHQSPKATPERPKRKRRRRRPTPSTGVRDPLSDRPKADLIAFAHGLERELAETRTDMQSIVGERDQLRAERDQAIANHLTLAEVHLGCEDRIFHLERQLATIEKERRDFRRTLLDQEGQG